MNIDQSQVLQIAVDTALIGANTLVSGIAGKRIVLVGWQFVPFADVTMRLEDSAGAHLTGAVPVGSAGWGASFKPVGHVWTGYGKDLILNLGAAIQVGGFLNYLLSD